MCGIPAVVPYLIQMLPEDCILRISDPPVPFFVSGIVGGLVHHFHDLSFLFPGKGRGIGNDAFFFYAE